MRIKPLNTFLFFFFSIINACFARVAFFKIRGGAVMSSPKKRNAYYPLAVALHSKIEEDTDIKALEKALKSLSSAQKALKGLDGAAHEAYQRTHKKSSEKDLVSVSGRARRTASRTACTADAFLAAELCDFIENNDQFSDNDQGNKGGTLDNREILLRKNVRLTKATNVTVLALWEPTYGGGVGVEHGGIKDLSRVTNKSNKGRLLVIIKDSANKDMKETIDVLDSEPWEVELQSGLIANEIASVQFHLYQCAGRVLREIQPLFADDKLVNKTDAAIHFVGQSLGGGVACLAAAMIDGSLPLPEEKKRKRKKRKVNDSKDENGRNNKSRERRKDDSKDDDGSNNKSQQKMSGYGQGRSSATVLGVPPCISANVRAAFVKSIIYGDDIVCRTTQKSIQRLCKRIKKHLKGGLLGKNLGWMTDTMSLTISNMKDHARGSEGEESKLVVPGQAFLIRPRRHEGKTSMHEVGGLKGGREALRAAILWQLNDVLLSESHWKHHGLESYIEGLDRVKLRGFGDS